LIFVNGRGRIGGWRVWEAGVVGEGFDDISRRPPAPLDVALVALGPLEGTMSGAPAAQGPLLDYRGAEYPRSNLMSR